MPTNILRKRHGSVTSRDAAKSARPKAKRDEPRVVAVKIGRVAFEAELLDTRTADRIWAALPLYGVAETWGAAVHCELPVDSGREAKPTALATADRLYYWAEEDRVIIVFGATPISRPGELRLPVPCAAWAMTSADLTALSVVKPGQKVSLTRRK